MARIYGINGSIYNGTNYQNTTVNHERTDYVTIPATLCLSIALAILLFLIVTIGFISKLRNGRPQRQMMKFIFLSQNISVFTTLFIFLVVNLRNDVISETGCFVVAILLHYLILVTMMWGSMEVLGCYFVYVKLIGLDFLGYRWKMLANSLAVPLVPVIILSSIDNNTYSCIDSYSCWYQVNVLHYGLILPGVMVTVSATIISTVIIVHTVKSSSQTTQGQRTRRRIITRVCKVFSCVLLNVLIWIFGHFAQSSRHHDVLFYYLVCLTSLGYSCLMFKRSIDKLSLAYWKSVIYRNNQGDPV